MASGLEARAERDGQRATKWSGTPSSLETQAVQDGQCAPSGVERPAVWTPEQSGTASMAPSGVERPIMCCTLCVCVEGGRYDPAEECRQLMAAWTR
ncbi:hypothetical protein chiPu_0006325 [Chiloscyllium punctatum]|uniref:Uncharacterized protein n=1 Tax=Chiloscyllium punctatum TaxID=137246 RepID=A0A401SBW3_CHIPU|nr:hypothetical protein [Chiloscyllium punctatum]